MLNWRLCLYFGANFPSPLFVCLVVYLSVFLFPSHLWTFCPCFSAFLVFAGFYFRGNICRSLKKGMYTFIFNQNKPTYIIHFQINWKKTSIILFLLVFTLPEFHSAALLLRIQSFLCSANIIYTYSSLFSLYSCIYIFWRWTKIIKHLSRSFFSLFFSFSVLSFYLYLPFVIVPSHDLSLFVSVCLCLCLYLPFRDRNFRVT